MVLYFWYFYAAIVLRWLIGVFDIYCMNKILVPRLQFYIDHSCNLACPNCLSFNNFRIHGRSSWDANRASTLAWAERILVEDLTIIGGEPLLHPEIHSWVMGVRECFPSVEDFKVCTNGTRLGHQDPAVLEQWHAAGVVLEVHCHSDQHWHSVWSVLDQRFPGYTVQTFEDQPVLHSCETRVSLDGRLLAWVRKSKNFLPHSIRSTERGFLEFYNTDPLLSHRSCEISDCFYIVEGLMYKCGMIAAGATASGLSMEPRARQLFDSYTALSPAAEDLQQQLAQMYQPVPQCSLCPVFGSIEDPRAVVDLVLPERKPRLGR